MNWWPNHSASGALLCLLLAGTANAFDNSVELTDVQREIYDSDHLVDLDAGSTLRYQFTKQSSLEPGFSDDVLVEITGLDAEGRRDVAVEFLSGERGLEMGPFQGFRGNPVIMVTLERDVQEMSRLTGGTSLFFRNRIRNEMARDLEVENVSLEIDGRQVTARRILLTPYADAPLIDRFSEFRDKEYEILLSEDVPGSVQRIRIFTPGPEGGDALFDEALTFVEAAAQ